MPGQCIRSPKNIVLVVVGAAKDAPQHPAGDPAVKVDGVAEGKRAGERHPARADGHILRAQLLQLSTKHRLQPTRARGEEGLVLHTHISKRCQKGKTKTETILSPSRNAKLNHMTLAPFTMRLTRSVILSNAKNLSEILFAALRVTLLLCQSLVD